MNKFSGVIWGMLSGASFGLIPLFTLPLFAAGLDTDSVLFYRFSFASVILAVILLFRGENFRITGRQALKLSLLGVFYMASSLFLIWGYEFMAAGIATAVHFLYPVCVVLVMTLFFGERISIKSIGAIILAVLGVALLSSAHGADGAVSAWGLFVVVISSVAYALYIVGVKRLNLESLGGFKLTFFGLLVTAILFSVKAFVFGQGVVPLDGGSEVFNIFMLALVPTVLSNFALVNAIKRVGSTTTSILGALEPMTAVAIGVAVFDEPISIVLLVGVVMIIGAVVTIVLNKGARSKGANKKSL